MFPEKKSRENKTNCFLRDHTLIVLLYKVNGKNKQTKTACGQQLRNCIPVGIHLNLIRARDQESTKQSAHFVERKSSYITISTVLVHAKIY